MGYHIISQFCLVLPGEDIGPWQRELPEEDPCWVSNDTRPGRGRTGKEETGISRQVLFCSLFLTLRGVKLILGNITLSPMSSLNQVSEQ